MTEARRLLERLLPMAEYATANAEGRQTLREARAYLAQPMTTCEAREGELVAALEPLLQSFDSWCRLDRHGICRSHLNDKPCTVVRVRRAFKDISRAALAQCDTCKGTRVAPDPDLGGAGVTNSSCPDCVLE